MSVAENVYKWSAGMGYILGYIQHNIEDITIYMNALNCIKYHDGKSLRENAKVNKI